MPNPIDEEFAKLYKQSKGIIEEINKLMLDFKKIDDKLNLGFVNEDFRKLLDTNINECNDLGDKIMKTSQRIVIFGPTSSGKSSFLNALMFQSEVLPVGSASKTKCFLEIKQSKTNTNYLIVNNKQENISNLQSILTNAVNRDFLVNLFYDFKEKDYFGNNIIIDTPGIDFDKGYNERIINYCNEADVVILVLNASCYIGKEIQKFCRKFKRDLSKINLFVVFNYYDVIQPRKDWLEGIEENIKLLEGIFPTFNRAKMACISSLERMQIITKNNEVSEQSKSRNELFEVLSEQLKNERGQVSLVRRYDYLLEILEIMFKNQLCIAEMMNSQSIFFDVNLRILSNLPLFIKQINKVAFSYCGIILKESREIIKDEQINGSDEIPLIINENVNDCENENIEPSQKQRIEELLKKIENEIKQKIMKEIINYFERNKGNENDKLIYVMKNIYFPIIMEKRYLVDSEKVIECVKNKSTKAKMIIGAVGGGLALGAVGISIPFWPVMLALELAVGTTAGICLGGVTVGAGIGGGLGAVAGKIINDLSEKISLFQLKDFMKNFAKGPIGEFSKFKQQTRKYLNLEKRKQKIKNQIDNFETKMVLYQISGDIKMENKIDIEFVELYKESKEIIGKIDQLIMVYKHIDDDVNIRFVNEEFLKLLKTDIKNCKNLGMKLSNNSKKIVFFGEANSGKSSVINALIFQSTILPIDPASTTKCFVEIKRSIIDDSYLMVDEKRENISKLKKIITEGNIERNICLFHNFEKSNIFSNHVIIDTPEIISDDLYDTRMLEYLAEADFVILVINFSDNFGQTIKEFYKKFKEKFQQNLYVVLNVFCDKLELHYDWEELKEAKTKLLTEIFPNIDQTKIAFISSLERIEINKKKKKVFENDQIKNRNDSFEKLSKQIKSKSDEISFHYRHDYLQKILAIMNEKRLDFSELVKEQFQFLHVDFKILFDFPNFEIEIEEIVKSLYVIFLLKICKVYTYDVDIENNHENIAIVETGNQDPLTNENLVQSENVVMKTIINEIENEIKQKIKEKIIDFIDTNICENRDQIKFIVNQIYFPKIIDKKQFVYCGNILEDVKEIRNNIRTALEDANDETKLCIMFTKIPLWSLLIPIEMARDIMSGTNFEGLFAPSVSRDDAGDVGVKILNILLEKNALGNSLKTFGDAFIHSFSKFKTKIIEYSNYEETEQNITENIDEFAKKVKSFRQRYLE